jgi:carbon storage regulator
MEVADMLVLTRRPGEALHLTGGISITVLEIRGDQVRIGIAAPQSIFVVRAELATSLQSKNDASHKRG